MSEPVDAKYVGRAACAHSRVVRVTQTSTIGLTSEWWQCDSCPTMFAALAARPASDAEKREHIADAGKMMCPWCDNPLALHEPDGMAGTPPHYREGCKLTSRPAVPASAEPVAWAIREADGKWTSGNTYRTEERASRMVRALTSEGAHGLRVFPLYTTPPAAAQDREDAARYRFLRDNPLQLRAIDGNATWYDKPADYFDEHTDNAMSAARAAGATDGK